MSIVRRLQESRFLDGAEVDRIFSRVSKLARPSLALTPPVFNRVLSAEAEFEYLFGRGYLAVNLRSSFSRIVGGKRSISIGKQAGHSGSRGGEALGRPVIDVVVNCMTSEFLKFLNISS